jgi:hypothetical protein
MFFYRFGFRMRSDDPVDSGGILLPERARQFGEVSGSDPQSR